MGAVIILADLFATSLILFEASAMRGLILRVTLAIELAQLPKSLLTCLELRHHRGSRLIHHAFAFVYVGLLGP